MSVMQKSGGRASTFCYIWDMPYKAEKIMLPDTLDRRRKLTLDERQEIRSRYEAGGCSYMSLAREYGVSKKTVNLICNDESDRVAREYRKAHWADYRHSREYWARVTREHRQYKQQLHLDGKI